MACQECEALCLLIQKHSAKISVSDTNLTLVCNRTGDTESLKACADPSGCLCSALCVLLDGDGCAQLISPLYILKTDGLCALYDAVGIYALAVGKRFNFLKIFESVLVKDRLQLRHTSFIILK